jgi:hypothetical protein
MRVSNWWDFLKGCLTGGLVLYGLIMMEFWVIGP